MLGVQGRNPGSGAQGDWLGKATRGGKPGPMRASKRVYNGKLINDGLGKM